LRLKIITEESAAKDHKKIFVSLRSPVKGQTSRTKSQIGKHAKLLPA